MEDFCCTLSDFLDGNCEAQQRAADKLYALVQQDPNLSFQLLIDASEMNAQSRVICLLLWICKASFSRDDAPFSFSLARSYIKVLHNLLYLGEIPMSDIAAHSLATFYLKYRDSESTDIIPQMLINDMTQMNIPFAAEAMHEITTDMVLPESILKLLFSELFPLLQSQITPKTIKSKILDVISPVADKLFDASSNEDIQSRVSLLLDLTQIKELKSSSYELWSQFEFNEATYDLLRILLSLSSHDILDPPSSECLYQIASFHACVLCSPPPFNLMPILFENVSKVYLREFSDKATETTEYSICDVLESVLIRMANNEIQFAVEDLSLFISENYKSQNNSIRGLVSVFLSCICPPLNKEICSLSISSFSDQINYLLSDSSMRVVSNCLQMLVSVALTDFPRDLLLGFVSNVLPLVGKYSLRVTDKALSFLALSVSDSSESASKIAEILFRNSNSLKGYDQIETIKEIAYIVSQHNESVASLPSVSSIVEVADSCTDGALFQAYISLISEMLKIGCPLEIDIQNVRTLLLHSIEAFSCVDGLMGMATLCIYDCSSMDETLKYLISVMEEIKDTEMFQSAALAISFIVEHSHPSVGPLLVSLLSLLDSSADICFKCRVFIPVNSIVICDIEEVQSFIGDIFERYSSLVSNLEKQALADPDYLVVPLEILIRTNSILLNTMKNPLENDWRPCFKGLIYSLNSVGDQKSEHFISLLIELIRRFSAIFKVPISSLICGDSGCSSIIKEWLCSSESSLIGNGGIEE